MEYTVIVKSICGIRIVRQMVTRQSGGNLYHMAERVWEYMIGCRQSGG